MTIRQCTAVGCEKKHHGKGFCSHHYTRLYHKGSVETPIVSLPLEEKLLALREISTNGCWEWLGYKDPAGYGQVGVNYIVGAVHRAAYKLWVGEIPDGMFVLHQCDNPPCFNPDHLFLGTDADNKIDMLSKNRQAKGEKSSLSKLQSSQISTIRAMLAHLSQADIAARFNVHQSTISCIARGKTWKHI